MALLLTSLEEDLSTTMHAFFLHSALSLHCTQLPTTSMSQEPISLICVIIYSSSAYFLSTYRIPTIKLGAEDNEQGDVSQSTRKVEQFNALKEIHGLM